MRVVIDTNVVASAIFFGGRPKEIIDKVMNSEIDAFASKEIIEEYMETVEYLIDKYPEKAPRLPLIDISAKINITDVKTKVNVCRDPDDDKFIECAVDSKCYYIVSGDKDILTVGEYNGIQVVTVAEFLNIL